MTKVRKSTVKKVKSTNSLTFKPDTRVAVAVVKAIAFLEKAGIPATPKFIVRYIHERLGNNFIKGCDCLQLPRYLNEGVQLGIFDKRYGSYYRQSRRRSGRRRRGSRRTSRRRSRRRR